MYKLIITMLVAFVGLQPTPAALAQDDERDLDDADLRSCISIRRIRQTKILDDRNMLFYLSGGQIYHNALRMTCSGLKREDRFSYETTGSQLCAHDRLSVLENSAFGLRTGFSCALGEFRRVTEDDVESLLEEPPPPPPAELPLPPPAEVGVENKEAGEDETG